MITSQLMAMPSDDEPSNDARHAVGAIICQSGGMRFTTNAVIVEARDVLLTVSHFNFDQRSDRELPVASCSFELPGAGKRGAKFSSRFHIVARGATKSELSESFALDWAVLRLSTPAPSAPIELGKLDALVSKRRAVFFSTLPSRKNGSSRPAVQVGCSLNRERDNSIVLLHSCNTKPGMSGSPFIVYEGGRPEVIAIHAKRTTKSAIAVGIEGQMRRAIIRATRK